MLDSSQLNSPNTYPSYSLENRKIHIIQNKKELISAIGALKLTQLIGFDSEQRPTFKKNESPHGVATIQLANLTECYIIQVKKIDNLTPLIELLENENIVKVGINLLGDKQALHTEFGITMKSTIEIDNILTKLTSRQTIGAKKAAKIFLKRNLQKSKNITISNWEIKTLSDKQIKYAAEDAAVVFDVTMHLLHKYPFVIQAMPSWFKVKFENDEY